MPPSNTGSFFLKLPVYLSQQLEAGEADSSKFWSDVSGSGLTQHALPVSSGQLSAVPPYIHARSSQHRGCPPVPA